MGISFSLLFIERSPSGMSPNSMAKWPQSQPPDPEPQPQPPFISPRDSGPYTDDADEYHVAEILALVASALNLLVATAL